VCAEKRRLFEELQHALNALTSVQNEQSKDVIAGGPGLPRIGLALQGARTNWENAKRRYREHLQEHGC
jgi:hypothetical protein